MTLLNVSELTKYYGAELIFSNLGFQVQRGEKIALVGVNGAGKSTLLKIIAGLEQADGGAVHITRGNRVAYLAQEVRFKGDHTLWQEMEAAFEHLSALRDEISALEPRIADTADPEWEECMERYGELTTRFEHAGGYDIERRIEMVLHGLNFCAAQYQQPLAQFSGGQKTRAGLAATLLSDPDLLLLDEPTNHLDLETLEWLEDFLRSWDGTLIVISHDRYFLDKVTNRTLEVVDGTLEDYPAGYNKYLELKAARIERRLKEYQAQQEYIAKTEEFIRRYKAGQRSKEAKGREKRLDRLKEQQKLRLSLDSQLRSGDLVLALHDLTVGYDQAGQNGEQAETHVLFSADNKELFRGERVGLLGPNGSGKTSLLRTLLNQQKPLKGKYQTGHQVAINYYAQGHDALDMDATILDELLRVDPKIGEERARTLLGSFLFSGDDVFKRIHMLSGGERSRVAIAQMMLRPGNVLILDEPTNHLDINSREVLEATLKEYPGSILFVSHDRQFIDALADKLWIIQDGQLLEHLGNYSDYAARLAAQRATEQQASQKQRERDGTSARAEKPAQEDRQRKKRLAALEAEVESLEQELERINTELEAASMAQDVAKIAALGQHYTEVETRLVRCYADWEQLAA